LKAQIQYVKELHKKDLSDGFESVYLPYALERKYPKAKDEIKWQFIFPMCNVSKDPRSGITRHHHLHPQTLGRNIKIASQTCKKSLTCKEVKY